MTADELADLTAASGLRPSAMPAEALRAAEEAADRRPGDAVLGKLVLALHGQVSAADGLPPHVAGVKRERLIRWDRESTTWEGFTPDGQGAMIRVLRPFAARDPVLRRALLRTAAALEPAVPGIAPIDGAWPALVLPVPGPAVPREPESAMQERFPLARWLATGVLALARWEASKLEAPRLAPDEWRHAGTGLTLACLTLGEGSKTAENLAALVEQIGDGDDEEDPVAAIAAAMRAAPPTRADDARVLLLRAFAEHLAGERHRLVAERARASRNRREAGLIRLVHRLDRALPPPEGRGAIGVDLDGRITVLTSEPARMTWGPAREEELVWSRESGVVPAVTRRLLRARATAAPSGRLQREVGGSVEVIDRVTRWLASALRLRTTRLILEKSAR